jgi:hypothetical protein
MGEGRRKRNSGAIRYFLYSSEREEPIKAESNVAPTYIRKDRTLRYVPTTAL